MKWTTMLYAALFPSSENEVRPAMHHMAKREDVVFAPSLGQYILYEAYFPIDAVVFLIGAYSPTDKELAFVVSRVLRAKSLVLTDKDAIGSFENLSSIVKSTGEVGKLLKVRNDIVAEDESFIIQNYIKKTQADIFSRLETRRNQTKMDPADKGTGESLLDDRLGRDHEYKEMIHRLKYVIYENRNISKALRREKEEFYRRYRSLSKSEILRTKISLSLGGPVISTPSLPGLINGINMPNKEIKVREWVYNIMALVEDLELKTRTKSTFEAKAIIKEFLEDCLRRKNGDYDSVFEMRSKILQLALGTKEKMDLENWRQEKYIKDTIGVIENIRSDGWLIKYNKDIAEAYITYLLTGQQDDKNRLLNHFK